MKKSLCYSLLLLATGCVSIPIRSNVTKDSIPKFTNILVVLEMKKASDQAANLYLSAFPSHYSICSIAYDALSIETLDEKINKQATMCNSEAVLMIRTTKTAQLVAANRYLPTPPYYFPSYRRLPGEFFMEMSLLSDKKPFWKAEIVDGFAVSDETINAKRIVNQLITDGVISK